MIHELAMGGGGVAGLAVLAAAALFLILAPPLALWAFPVCSRAGTILPDREIAPQDYFPQITDVSDLPSPDQQERDARQLALHLARSAHLKRLLVVAVAATGYSLLVFAYRGSQDLGGFLSSTAFAATLMLLSIAFAIGIPETYDCRGGRPGRFTTAKARIAIRHHTIQLAEQARFERQLRDRRSRQNATDSDDGEE